MDVCQASYATCRRLAKQSASNFYYSFRLLPKHQRSAMCALYAFLRKTDDIADGNESAEERRAALDAWRNSFQQALDGKYDEPILPAIADTVSSYQIPREYLFAAIDGAEMDLDGRGYETFADLEDYCYHAASVVGLACLSIWGFHGDQALEPARKCGVAFQLTNILRDLAEDARRGRVYLPQDELRQFDYSRQDLCDGIVDDRTAALMKFQVERAEQFYDEAAELAGLLQRDGRRMFGMMTATYRRLLEKIGRRDGDVFSPPVRLTSFEKLRIAGRWLLWPSPAPPTAQDAYREKFQRV